LLIVAAHPVVRAGFRHTFQDQDGIDIVGESGCAPEAASTAATECPDVVLIDLDSECTGFRAVTAIAEACDARLLVVTSATDAQIHARAIELGASGVVSKDQPVDLLCRAVHKVAAGEVWFERGKTEALLRRLTRRTEDPEAQKIGSLTKREREVVALVGEGLKNLAIAERLFISEATVRNHLTSILSKLDLSDRFELAVYSYRHELVRTAAAVFASAAGGVPTSPAQPVKLAVKLRPAVGEAGAPPPGGSTRHPS
jgi:DNA-binding NarL/FixJ family response regulator